MLEDIKLLLDDLQQKSFEYFTLWKNETGELKNLYFTKHCQLEDELELIRSIVDIVNENSKTESSIIKLALSSKQFSWINSNEFNIESSLAEFLFWKYGILLIIALALLICVGVPILLDKASISDEFIILGAGILLFVIYRILNI